MANILTAAEAAVVLRCDATDPNMLALLPLVDAFLKSATGHDWASDSSIRAEAKSAARMLITLWHENPAMMAGGVNTLNFGLHSVLSQLEVLALRYIEFEGLNGTGYICLPNAHEGDKVDSVVGLVGATGDQSSKFETSISEDGYLRQTSGDNLDEKFFRVYLIPLDSL